MKISPEPLHPLRNWHELWHAEPSDSYPALPNRTSFPAIAWKQSKRPAFRWFSQLFHRDLHK